MATQFYLDSKIDSIPQRGFYRLAADYSKHRLAKEIGLDPLAMRPVYFVNLANSGIYADIQPVIPITEPNMPPTLRRPPVPPGKKQPSQKKTPPKIRDWDTDQDIKEPAIH